ncbi:VanW family protein [uncultured Clostridium sp.]|uniref:VanW family protein n=1 Tax=uncultured Clostridium sp. TaxID=59620 RepID=UPI0028EF1FBA|nr:VanW family protein [uncultured Clostridium sp.]
MKRKKKRARAKKKAIIMILSIFMLLLLGFGSATVAYGYSYVKHYNNLIFPGVKVENVDISGKSVQDAKAILQKSFNDKASMSKLVVKTPGKDYTLGFDKVEPKYDIDTIVNEAFNYGKNLNLYKKYKIIKRPENKSFSLKFAYNRDAVQKFVDEIEKEVNKNPQDAKITKSNSGFNITSEVVGKKLNKEKLMEDILSNIEYGIKEDLQVTAVVQDVKARITKESLASIDGLISTFSTNYGNISSAERANNIVVSTKSIDGTLLMPGDVFSFNGVVGERTEARGYQAGPVIIGNKVESGLGGGICQVSSALYNSVLMSNMRSVERVHHTLPSSYVPLGRDATVDWGNIDYKFKNTLDFPVYIQGITSGGNVTFNIYSSQSLSKRRYAITNDVYSEVQSTTKTVEDSQLAEGTEEVVQKAYTGYKVKVYRNIYENEVLIKQELVSDDFYRPVEGLIKVGTKKK